MYVTYNVATDWAVNIACIYKRLMKVKEGSCCYVTEDELYCVVETSDGEQFQVNVFNLELI